MFRWLQPDPLTMSEEASFLSDELSNLPHTAYNEPVNKRDLNFNDLTNDRAEWQLGDVKLMDNDTVPHSLSSNEINLDRIHPTETWFGIRGGMETDHSCHGNETLIEFNGDAGQVMCLDSIS